MDLPRVTRDGNLKLAVSSDEQLLAVAYADPPHVVVHTMDPVTVVGEVAPGHWSDVQFNAAGNLAVCEYRGGTVQEVEPRRGEVVRRGKVPHAFALACHRDTLAVLCASSDREVGSHVPNRVALLREAAGRDGWEELSRYPLLFRGSSVCCALDGRACWVQHSLDVSRFRLSDGANDAFVTHGAYPDLCARVLTTTGGDTVLCSKAGFRVLGRPERRYGLGDGSDEVFAAAGNRVYRLSPRTGRVTVYA